MIGCTRQNEVSMNPPMRFMPYRSYIDSIVLANQQLFGNVLILDSLGEAFELLENWSLLSYSELRSEYSELNYTNLSIESHIVYDSLLYKYMQDYGLDYETDEVPFEVLADLEYIVFNNYQDLIPAKIVYDDELEREIGIIEPIGEFDLFALTNEQGIFIVDTFVYKAYSNGCFLAFPLSIYHIFAGLEFDNVAYMLQSSSYDDLIPDLPLVYFHDYYRGQELVPFYEEIKYNNDHTYRMNVSLQACAAHCCFWGTTTLSTKFKLKNYKLGALGWFYWLTSFPTTGYYNFTYEAYLDNNPHDIQESHTLYVNKNCSRYDDECVIARFTDGYFAHPHFGFLSHHFCVTNGRVTIE